MMCKVEQQKEMLTKKYAVLEKKIIEAEASNTAKQQVKSLVIIIYVNKVINYY